MVPLLGVMGRCEGMKRGKEGTVRLGQPSETAFTTILPFQRTAQAQHLTTIPPHTHSPTPPITQPFPMQNDVTGVLN